MDDVLIVGAGPAGTVAALVLARAGVRVRLVDRASFPRDKLCGDTVNPGTLALLGRLGIAGRVLERGLPVPGMLVTGENGIAITARYPRDLQGRVLPRRELDAALLDEAIAAGAAFDEGVAVRGALAEGSNRVAGVRASANGATRRLPARLTIAADGRRSALAFDLGLSRHPAAPRRWAIGGYVEGSVGLSAFGEMHIRRGRYLGVAPMPGGLANVCLVTPASASFRITDPAAVLMRAVTSDPVLRDRFAGARLLREPTVLGPLAVESDRGAAVDGLLLAGDAAGFIDPMTGDGLRFAVRGGVLAAEAALDALEHGWPGVHARLAAARRREFGPKWRFNRTLRALVASPVAVGAATAGASLAPGIVRAIVSRAGDCDLAGP